MMYINSPPKPAAWRFRSCVYLQHAVTPHKRTFRGSSEIRHRTTQPDGDDYMYEGILYLPLQGLVLRYLL